MFKKVSRLFLIFALIVTTSIPVFAEDSTAVGLQFLPSVKEYSSEIPLNKGEIAPRSPNGIPIKITPNSNGTGVKVYVGNIGIDSLDMVTVTVKATGHSLPQTQKSSVLPILGKTFSFDMPMIKASTTYEVTVRIVDGSGTRLEIGEGVLEYSESFLSGKWHRGTFSTRGRSLEHHLDNHGDEVDSDNLVDYLNKAMKYRSEVLKSTEDIRTSVGTGPIASTKYKHRIDGRFILLVDATEEILSFGI